MEKNQESQGLDLTGDVLKCSEGNPDSEDTSSCEPSGSNIDSENKVHTTEKDIEGDQMNTFEDVQYMGNLSDDEDDDDDTEEMDQEEDDYEIEYDVEEETNLEFLTTEDELLDSFFVDDSDSEKDCEAELGAENVAEAEREPIVFGVLSDLFPICVVTLDFKCFGYPSYYLRKLLKQRLWTQSPEILDQLIILYNLFKSSDTCLQLIECDDAIQFHVQVYELTAVEEFIRQVESTDFSNILACMLLSYNIREEIKLLNTQFSVTCHCENLNHWEMEYERTFHSFRFYYNHRQGSRWANNYTGWPGQGVLFATPWPGSSSFSPGPSEGNKVPKVSIPHQRIPEDAERCESTSVDQRSADFGKAVEDATMLDADYRTFLSSPCSNETSSREPLIARSSSVDHFPSKCDRSSTTTLNEKEMRRKSF